MQSSTSSLMFDDQFESVRQEVMNYSGMIDHLQSLGESENNVDQVDDIIQSNRDINRMKGQLKESIMKLEKVKNNYIKSSRGVDQRNKTKKLRDLYQKENNRFDVAYKEIQQDSSEEVKNMLKSNGDVKIKIKKTYNPQQNIFTKQKEEQELQTVDAKFIHIENDHLEFQNQLIKENQEELDTISYKAHQLQKIASDLSLEVDKQDEMLIVVDNNFKKTHSNVKGAQEQLLQSQSTQKKSTKKVICLFIFALIIIGVILLIVLL